MLRKSIYLWLVMVLTMIVLPACAFQQAAAGTEADAAEDVEAVTATVNQIYSSYASSLNSGDAEAWLSQWTDDGIQMPPGAPPVIGKEKIRPRVTGALDRFIFDMEISNEEVRVAGDWAFARGTYKLTMTPKQEGEVVPIDGKYLTIFEKQPDGTWKIFRDIFNSNVPPNQ